MKKNKLFLTLGCCVLFVVSLQAQTPQNVLDKALQNGHQLNTGTFQDILANYLQVAAKNITSTNSGAQLKLNWFALNSMDSVNKYNSNNFRHSGWQRSGEFITGIGMDKSGSFNSWQGGLNYNFLSRRDTDMRFYTKVYLRPFAEESKIILLAVKQDTAVVASQLEPLLTEWITNLYQKGEAVVDFKKEMDSAVPGMFQNMPSDDAAAKYLETQFNQDVFAHNPIGRAMTKRIHDIAILEATEILTVQLNAYVRSQGKTPLSYNTKYVTPAQTSAIVQFIDQQVAQNKYLNDTLKATKLTDLNKKVLSDYQALVKYVSRQPLLTAGYLFTYGKGSVLTSHVAAINFIYGTGSWKTVKEGQIKASLTDTVNSDDPTGKIHNLNRNVIALQAGYNQVIAMQKKVSILELNIAVENDWATSGYVAKTDKTLFYLDAYLRARLPSTPWLKLNLKYDHKNGNLLGLLDFTYNLDK